MVDLVYFMRSAIRVDLNDLRPTGAIFDVVGFDGELHCRLRNTKSPIRYLSDSRSLIFLI